MQCICDVISPKGRPWLFEENWTEFCEAIYWLEMYLLYLIVWLFENLNSADLWQSSKGLGSVVSNVESICKISTMMNRIIFFILAGFYFLSLIISHPAKKWFPKSSGKYTKRKYLSPIHETSQSCKQTFMDQMCCRSKFGSVCM